MCRERMCPNCAHNDWMLVEMPQVDYNTQTQQRKVVFLLQCRNCRKVYFSGEYWTPIPYADLSEDFNPSDRRVRNGRRRVENVKRRAES